MSARADSAARNLLARLIDEAELETAPLDEVRADLARLGIDPERAIRFSQRLAAEASAPASDLLAKSLAAEDSDREISELESADLDVVRAELSATTPLAAAHAQRLASKAMWAAAPRGSSRRLWYGIGGAITAIAASILIVVNLSTSDLAQPQMALAPPEVGTDALRLPQAEAPASPAPPLQAPAKSDSTSSATSASAGDSARTAGAGSNDAVFGEGGLSLQGTTDQAGATFMRPRSAAATGVGDLRIVAALILQPAFAPEPLRRSDLTGGDLPSRLAEAAHFPGRNRIVALVTLDHADGHRTDEMLMYLPVGNLSLQRSEAEGLSDYAVSRNLNEADLIQPTLRQLLGKDIDQFQLVEMKPPAAAGPK